MRRIALLGLILLLPACQNYAGSPFVGFGGFIGDVETFKLNPNKPVGDAPNLARVQGNEVDLPALTPEPGDIWPGPIPPEPTLQDLQRQQNLGDVNPAVAPRGSSTPPAIMAPAPNMVPVPPPILPKGGPPPTSSAPSSAPTTMIYQTPKGPVVGTQTGNGVQTYTDPKGGTGIVVPNGNGTSTLIGSDGSVLTVPTPR
jgi:hypothetical protein